jgi:dihydropteroate synthase
MLPDFKTLKTMGVINITPNSFSDPQKFFYTQDLGQTLKAQSWKKDLILDFGFESTAPMNESISAEMEKKRFDRFFELIADIDLDHRWISFDTYRPESFLYFSERFKSRYKGQGHLFNDVSGVLDSELARLLKDKARDQSFLYLYSFTHIPDRAETGKHMNFLREGDVFARALEKFKEAEKQFKKLAVDEQVIFDPCFGFSKTFEQNWDLIRRFPELKKSLANNRSWLVGLSKKSFLRNSLPPETTDLFTEAEKLHERLLAQFMKENNGHVFYRVHDFDIVSRAQNKLS